MNDLLSQPGLEQRIKEDFTRIFGEPPSSILPLSAHASARRMLRVKNSKNSLLAVLNSERPENDAFVKFTAHFRALNLPVPEVYQYYPEIGMYLEQDLGDVTLADKLAATRCPEDPFPAAIENLYRQVLSLLPLFQIKAARTFDYSWCHPYKEFGRDSMLYDLQAFHERFLKNVDDSLSYSVLEQDYEEIVAFLEKAHSDYFLYRDFQSRNIMLCDEKPFFIDYQGGRKGALQYDVVSLLYQSSAEIPEEARGRLLEHYLSVIAEIITVDTEEFKSHYQGFIACRMMQVLGVYGLQGIEKKKEYFLNSIPKAVHTLCSTLESKVWPLKTPDLLGVVRKACKLFPL